MDTHGKPPTTEIVQRPPADRTGMSPVVVAGLAILEQNPSPETLRELLAMQREYEANEARKAYTAALVGLKASLPKIIAHDRTVAFSSTRYTHASLGAAVEAVTPHLIEHGFAFSWHPATPTPAEVAVTCRLTHRGGHFEEVTLKSRPDDKGSKNPAQAVMSTVTMLERYTLLALLGIATADMSDPAGDDGRKPDPGRIDSARNLRAVGRLKQLGRTREQAEAFLGRMVKDWTGADIERLTAWASPDDDGAAES